MIFIYWLMKVFLLANTLSDVYNVKVLITVNIELNFFLKKRGP